MSWVKSDEPIVQSETITGVQGGIVRHFTGFVLVGMLAGLSMSGLNAFGQEAKDKPVYTELTFESDAPVHFFDGNLTSAARIQVGEEPLRMAPKPSR